MTGPEMIPVESIKRLDVHPGETLVATTQYPLDSMDVEHLTAQLKEFLPDGVQVIVKSKDVEFEVVASAEVPDA